MNSPKISVVQLPASAVSKQTSERDAKILRRSATTLLDKYSQSIVKDGDWLIKEQPVHKLPRDLTDLISLELRDRGNELIEETRLLNNQLIDRSMHKVSAHFCGDLEVISLGNRILEWTQVVMQEVLYRARRQIQADPAKAYDRMFHFVRDIDTRIAHGDERMYQLVWAPAVDCMSYFLLDVCFLQNGFARYAHGEEATHRPRLDGPVRKLPETAQKLADNLHLFGVEPAFYLRDVILKPLAAYLPRIEQTEPERILRSKLHAIFSDLLEALPYLWSTSRPGRYIFAIPGTTCFGAFYFLSAHGAGAFGFCDTEDDMRRGLETNHFRAGIDIGFDGRMSDITQLWMTIENILGESALAVSCWLLESIHGRIVEDYLKVRSRRSKDAIASDEVSDEPADADQGWATYSSWVREVEDSNDGWSPTADEKPLERDIAHSLLPQVRQSRFFKVLRACGVDIVQGKGSERKLLRQGARPFRLGNHYGPNPVIPSFLACQILRRLDITRAEWSEAIAAVRL